MPFTTGNDKNILQATDAGVVGAGAGDDTYIIGGLDATQSMTISDGEGTNVLWLPTGLTIASSLFAADSAQLTLSSGAVININGASSFSYRLGGDPIAGTGGATQDYSGFVTSSMGAAAMPTGSNTEPGGANTGVNADGSTSNSGVTPTFTLVADAAAVDEGASATFTLTTTAADGDYAYTITGGVDTGDVSDTNADGDGNSLTGVATVVGGTATITASLLADLSTEGAETLTVTMNDDATATADVTVNDTSLTPAPAAMRDDQFNNLSPVIDAATLTIALDDDGVQSGSDGDTVADEVTASAANITSVTSLIFGLDDIVDTGDFSILNNTNFNDLDITINVDKANLQNDANVNAAIVGGIPVVGDATNDVFAVRSTGNVDVLITSDVNDAQGLSGLMTGLGVVYVNKASSVTVTTASQTNVLNSGQLAGASANNGGFDLPNATTVSFNTASGAIRGVALNAPVAQTLNIDATSTFGLFGAQYAANSSVLTGLTNINVQGTAVSADLTGSYGGVGAFTGVAHAPIAYAAVNTVSASGFSGALFQVDLSNEADTSGATAGAQGANIDSSGSTFSIITGTQAGDTIVLGALSDIVRFDETVANPAGVTTNGSATLVSGGDNSGMDVIQGFSATASGADVLHFNSDSAIAAGEDPGALVAAFDVAPVIGQAPNTVSLQSNANSILSISGANATEVDTLAEWLHLVGNMPTNDVYAFEFDGSTYVVDKDVAGGTANGVNFTQNVVKLEGVTGVTRLIDADAGLTAPLAALNALTYLSTDQAIGDAVDNLELAIGGIAQDNAVLIL